MTYPLIGNDFPLPDVTTRSTLIVAGGGRGMSFEGAISLVAEKAERCVYAAQMIRRRSRIGRWVEGQRLATCPSVPPAGARFATQFDSFH